MLSTKPATEFFDTVGQDTALATQSDRAEWLDRPLVHLLHQTQLGIPL
jgi:hypothetical protein